MKIGAARKEAAATERIGESAAAAAAAHYGLEGS